MSWRRGQGASRSRSKILTAIPSSCSSHRGVEERSAATFNEMTAPFKSGVLGEGSLQPRHHDVAFSFLHPTTAATGTGGHMRRLTIAPLALKCSHLRSLVLA